MESALTEVIVEVVVVIEIKVMIVVVELGAIVIPPLCADDSGEGSKGTGFKHSFAGKKVQNFCYFLRVTFRF